MENPIAERPGFAMYRVSSTSKLSFEELGQLTNESWAADYKDEVRFIYDASYLEWLLGNNDWGGFLIRETDLGRPVAFAYSLYRKLYLHGVTYPARFSSGLSVLPSYRRRGLSRWMYEVAGSRMYADTHSRTIEFATLQVRHAGLPSDQRNSATSTERMETVYLQPCYIWKKRLKGDISSIRSCSDSKEDISLFNIRTFDEVQRIAIIDRLFEKTLNRISIGFIPETNFLRLYVDGVPNSRSGFVVVDLGGEINCALSYSIFKAAVNEHEIGHIVQIQGIYGECCDDDIVVAVLSKFAQHIRTQCIALSVIDQGYVKQKVLERAGFSISTDSIIYRLRAMPSIINACRNVSTPYALDFY